MIDADRAVLGAKPDGDGTLFGVWATTSDAVSVRIFADGEHPVRDVPLEKRGSGFFAQRVEQARAGTLYKFVLDGRELPDPYARFLPYGVHGPAEVISPTETAPFRPDPIHSWVLYELHVGAFTEEGTYDAAAERLVSLAELGVNAIEVMPLSSFPGSRGWGYDGVAHFAPFSPYGRPEDLRRFVQRAHALHIAVLLDVVYNHFGPSGNYLGAYAPEYFLEDEASPWGVAPDFAQPMMQGYVLDNARMWFDEYGFDGLRLDATHTLVDRGPVQVLRELRELGASYTPGKVLIAEDERNEPGLVTELGLDAVWADDFHHQVRVLLTGERDGYYAAYQPSLGDLARLIERGWLYEGQAYAPWGRPRGQPAGGLDPSCLVYCVENHDQVGNRPFGNRLSDDAGHEALLVATAVLLFLPTTPLLFMGQEWAATSPFLYFTEHDPELGARVSEGRRQEFASFRLFGDDAARRRIPDPQAAATFHRSKLRWEESRREPHRSARATVKQWIALRRHDPVLREPAERQDLRADVVDGLLRVSRRSELGVRTLWANLTRETRPLPRTTGSVLAAAGECQGHSMGPRSAMVVVPPIAFNRDVFTSARGLL